MFAGDVVLSPVVACVSVGDAVLSPVVACVSVGDAVLSRWWRVCLWVMQC